ncbi:1-(5-phosphoribosyl)-5-((5-phosphoribosylamino)methylideneamino)imidazole-4-carboxamide isomerase, partial [bacterium]|nr:1-(5-phosphoribosyl)-5-((5-phosphoribosylamino)methylideneamino)imidazole-4-carboxamide isomerase [bacterium]
MRIIPAIDMMSGRCVRLKQGLRSSKKEYESQPLRAALRWQSAGASWLHVVNLDGAFGQADANAHALAQLLTGVNIPVQLGGGIRSLEDAARWLDLGVSRVILGTLAVADPVRVEQAVKRFGADRVAVGADAKDNRIAIQGWVEETDKQL